MRSVVRSSFQLRVSRCVLPSPFSCTSTETKRASRPASLHAVAAFVAAVAEAARVGGIGGRITFKIRAGLPVRRTQTGQIIEEHLELRLEEIAPARGEMIEERRLVRREFVMAFVETMDLRERKISTSADPRWPCAQTNAGAAATPNPDR